MPLILPEGLIDHGLLKYEQIFTMDNERAYSQDIRPLKIGIVNLMPNKEETEVQLLRMLSNTALQVDISLIRTKTYKSKNTSKKHLETFYKTYEDIRDEKFDGLVVTGAPVERLEYEEIIYWPELRDIFEFARTNVYSTLFICWSAQAGLYHFYNIGHNLADEKIFGIYSFEKNKDYRLLRGFDDRYWMPQSRYTYLKEEDLLDVSEDINILACRPDTGLALAATEDNRFVFCFGHWEYGRDTLHNEYMRDLKKGKNINIPLNYYRGDDPQGEIIVNWSSSANLFFANWINYCVYQNTPYNINEIQAKEV